MSPGQSAIAQRDWGLHIFRGCFDLGDVVFVPKIFGLYIWANFPPGDGTLSSPCAAGPRRWTEGQHSPRVGSMSPVQSAITKWDWGLHTLRDSIDPGNVRFRPRVVGVVEIWANF